MKLPGSSTVKAAKSTGTTRTTGTSGGQSSGSGTGITAAPKGSSAAVKTGGAPGKTKAGSASQGIDARYLMGWKPETESRKVGKGGDATASIAEIVEKYSDGTPLLALADGGRKSRRRTKVDFKL